jgi:hypothetical protein
MTGLLEKVLAAHGGLDNWKQLERVDFRLTLRGRALEVKQQPNGLRDVLVRVDAKRPRTLISPFPVTGSVGIFDRGRVRLESTDGAQVSELAEARKSFAGYESQTPWSDSQFMYFIGYALHNYMTMPFLLATDGVECEEQDTHEENNETWRVLKVTFPAGMDVHCREQKFYFNESGYLVRNDYAPEVSGNPAAHYSFDHQNFDGFVFPTHRRVVGRDQDGRTHVSGPSIFRLEIESVLLS